jgi:hypothetical protein
MNRYLNLAADYAAILALTFYLLADALDLMNLEDE